MIDNKQYADLSEKVTATFYDEQYEEWTEKTVTIKEILDTTCDDYTVVEMPSAQPEIIHCKDCKDWMRAYLDISGKHGCNVMRDYTAPNDYCFKAERKE